MNLEPRNRAWMPVLDFAQDGIDVVGYRATAFAGVADRNRSGCNVVGEIRLRLPVYPPV